MNQLDISAFETAVARENLAVRGLRVYRDGALIASYQPQPEERQNQYSGTKSFTSTACALSRRACSPWTTMFWTTSGRMRRKLSAKT